MKKILKQMTALCLIAVLLLCCSCGEAQGPKKATRPEDEVRAVWLCYFELAAPAGGTEAAFRERFGKGFRELADFGINTVFVQVRPFADAIYPSALFPWSDIFGGKQGVDPGFDPLAVLLRLGQEHGLAIHAWINPFRASRSADASKLAPGHPILPHIEADDGWARQADGRWYWNPALPEVHALVYAGVRELLENYALAGIHIDDYFYPTKDAAFDAAQYESYRKRGGGLALGDWRREMVSQFVAGLYRETKRIRPDAVVSISPAANIEKNYADMYADLERWTREPGFADWIIPQLYFGFENQSMPFERWARRWAALVAEAEANAKEPVKLIFGLGLYKAGLEDAYAGAGSGEWLGNNRMIAEQLEMIRKLPAYYGLALFSFNSLAGESLSKAAKREKEHLEKLF
ncbi:MAG: family 10 glycosylhydrolase [Oscillospiraceae bacterium]|nr:family 10 glycosylhydrolase [Oscillospiraceae bacterium]